MKHKPIPKKIRQKVYEKCNGHCAYCGCEIEYKDMQVYHASSLWGNVYLGNSKIQNDSLDNLMPVCRQCNLYKGGSNIEAFRTFLKETFEKNSLNTWQIRFCIKYGMIEKHPWDGKFYFEKLQEQTDNN